MERSEVKAIVAVEIEPMMRRLGIAHWKVSLDYESIRPDSDGVLKRGECTRLVDYNSAYISLNPDSFADREAVVATLRHELFHIVLSPYDLYSSTIDRVEALGPIADVLGRV